MADQNSYLAYKRDTRHLLYWMIHAYNRIVKTSSPLSIFGDAPATVNTTGQIKVSALVPIAKLIAEHINSVPSTIFRLFQSVIDARSAAYGLFQRIVARKPDPDMEKSNVSHKCFIDALTSAFKALGGDEWASQQKPKTGNLDEEDIQADVFANKFSALGLGESDDEEEEEDEGEPHNRPVSAQKARLRKKPSGKGKKGKRGKKAKGKPVVKEPSLDEVPLESYGIIEDEDDAVTDYLMAVYSFFAELIELRQYVQDFWHEVAYSGLNSAVAGTLSNMAVAMVKQAELSIFLEFPGHDRYETIVNTMTRGNADNAQGMFHIDMQGTDPDQPQLVESIDIDVKEQFFIHAYQDLLAFALDFQKNRNGKPTKAMLAQIRDWDPKFDLQQATEEQRIEWRRSYTINWLYDLVNVFSAVVVQQNASQEQKIDLETVDWSTTGPWHRDRRLFGLNEFAGEVTTLAFQKPGTDIRSRILPHTVFQLACIVDSFAISRGWIIGCLEGHIMGTPPRDFRPGRDVDIFLDRNGERDYQGYCGGVHILAQIFNEDAEQYGEPNRQEKNIMILEGLRVDFLDWLGETKYGFPLASIPPSRFISSNPNGLWEYSPYLNGVGLMESLELAYGVNLLVWGKMTEPVCIIHLHNMLVQTGYLKKPVGLFESLQKIFASSFFPDGKVPTSKFRESLGEILRQTFPRRGGLQRQALGKAITRNAKDLHDILDRGLFTFYKQTSFLRILREAGWLVDRIPDEDIDPASLLGTIRMSQTKQVTDPETGQKKFVETPLIKAARASGTTDESIFGIANSLQNPPKQTPLPEELLPKVHEGYTSVPSQFKDRVETGYNDPQEMLNFVKIDITNDICGEIRPISSLNYTWVTVHMLFLIRKIEEELEKLRNPIWARIYKGNPSVSQQGKRAMFTQAVLEEQDHECMEVMAQRFEDLRIGFVQFIYWDGLDKMEDIVARASGQQESQAAHPDLGKIYFAARRDAEDEDMLSLFSRQLNGTKKDAGFGKLHSNPWNWRLEDDIIHPWGDRRAALVRTVWKFDFDQDKLLFEKRSGKRWLSLCRLRQQPVGEGDFETFQPVVPPTIPPNEAFPPPYWQPNYTAPQRNKALVSRLLFDFSHQWRHILRSNYNSNTFRKIARATILIATMQFRVVEDASPRRGKGGSLVSILKLPQWEPLGVDIFSLGDTRVILTQDLGSATSLVWRDSSGFENGCRGQRDCSIKYLILSVRHIALCHFESGTLKYTSPEPFLNGLDPPSDAATSLLILATLPRSLNTALHHLPEEIQNMILDNVSLGSIEGARAGCVLGLGSPFTWKVRGKDLKREEGHRNRSTHSPVEEQIWFGDQHSGIVYKCDS
ncbi:hypothetical protein FQN54_009925 [Arachnomyces sp. PD_36]|nr:hypothetical protein FQN54_009925 [Arachnomyces sp. PD_36]